MNSPAQRNKNRARWAPSPGSRLGTPTVLLIFPAVLIALVLAAGPILEGGRAAESGPTGGLPSVESSSSEARSSRVEGGDSTRSAGTSRNERSTPSRAVLPSSSAIAPHAETISDPLVRQTQIGLQMSGYYHGAIDARMSREVKASLVRFQSDHRIPITGTITPEVQDVLQIAGR